MEVEAEAEVEVIEVGRSGFKCKSKKSRFDQIFPFEHEVFYNGKVYCKLVSIQES